MFDSESDTSSHEDTLEGCEKDHMQCFLPVLLKAGYKNGKRLSTSDHLEAGVSESQLLSLIHLAQEAFQSEPTLLNIPSPINVVGDLHGQYTDLLRIFDAIGHPPHQRYLFLGDYVDRGLNSIETVSLLMTYKVLYPNHVYMLRGNHESAEICRVYGFYAECRHRFSIRLWRKYTECFRFLPIAAVIEKRIFCAHGGISPSLNGHLDDLNKLERPLTIGNKGVVTDLLWSDPDPKVEGWALNARGISFTYGPDIIKEFLTRHNLDLIVRAHQVVEDGYKFVADRRLVTVFSATNYCGEFDNCGGVLLIDKALTCSFKILKPLCKCAKKNNDQGKEQPQHGHTDPPAI